MLILVCLKAKTLPMALNMILLSFTSKHNCHGTVSRSQFSPPMEITTCLAKLTLQGRPQLCDFSSANTSKQGDLCPISPIQHFTFLNFCPHIPSRHQKRPFMAGYGKCQVIHQALSEPICFRKKQA